MSEAVKQRGPRLSIIPAAAVTDARLTPRALQVLCLLGRHTNDNGWCRVRQTKLASEVGCARSTLQTALDVLVDAGWVEVRLEGRPGLAEPDPDKQPYASHAYRVLLDPKDGSVGEVQVPEKSGTPGADPIDRHPVPTHASAPNERPFDNDLERERAREGLSEEARRRLAMFQRKWPTTALDDCDAMNREWSKLSDADQQSAIDAVEPFLALQKAHGRTKTIGGVAFLRDRRFDLVEKRHSATREELVVIKTWSREWWGLLLAKVERGEPTAAMVEHAMSGGGTRERTVRATDLPPLDQFEACPGNSNAWAEWRAWLKVKGVELPSWRELQVVHLPASKPPTHGQSIFRCSSR